MTTFVLIHSPLVGPLTWSLIAEELRARGHKAITPSLIGPHCADVPFWREHIGRVPTGVPTGVPDVPPGERIVLVAHSGTGPLMPALGQSLAGKVAAYVFVDAALPGRDGQSRLDMFSPTDAQHFRAAAVDGIIARVWRNDDVLRATGIVDADLRRRFAAEVPDVPLAVYEEPLPVLASWPDAPCGYLLFSAPYEADSRVALARGWVQRKLTGGHFHMLADAPAVTDALLDLSRAMGVA